MARNRSARKRGRRLDPGEAGGRRRLGARAEPGADPSVLRPVAGREVEGLVARTRARGSARHAARRRPVRYAKSFSWRNFASSPGSPSPDQHDHDPGRPRGRPVARPRPEHRRPERPGAGLGLLDLLHQRPSTRPVFVLRRPERAAECRRRLRGCAGRRRQRGDRGSASRPTSVGPRTGGGSCPSKILAHSDRRCEATTGPVHLGRTAAECQCRREALAVPRTALEPPRHPRSSLMISGASLPIG